jgi:hypothetical protein
MRAIPSRLSAIATAITMILAAGPALADDFAAPNGDVLLTITGSITAKNGADSLQLDYDQLASLPQTTFTTSTTWTPGTPTFTGVLMKDLIAAVGATGETITLTAANDYAITLPLDDVQADAPLLAFLMDGQPMSLRDKGPVWMVYPYDAEEKYRTEETYSRSIWQMTAISFGE